MTAEEVRDILLRAAEVTGWTEIVIIGSQAVHGTIENPDIDIVMLSPDVDLYPKSGYQTNATWERLISALGQDSDFHVETLRYVESVSETLARFPAGWKDRAISKTIGTIGSNAEELAVTATFPEIHDLIVSKLSVPENRQKDVEFMRAVVRLGLVDRETLLERYRNAPRTTDEKIELGLRQIEEAFDSYKKPH